MTMSQAHIRASAKYNKAKYDDVKIRVPKGYRDEVLRVAASIDGVSINEYVMSAVSEKIIRDHPDLAGADAWKISKQ